MANPNTSPIFIESCGILGSPIELTNQICNPDNPGNIPVKAYSNTGSYAGGNGALIENIAIELTGTVPATVICAYIRMLSETIPKWRKFSSLAIPGHTFSLTSALPSYSMPLKSLLFPSNSSQGLRINPEEIPIEIGFALTVASSSPIIIWLFGGEY